MADKMAPLKADVTVVVMVEMKDLLKVELMVWKLVDQKVLW